MACEQAGLERLEGDVRLAVSCQRTANQGLRSQAPSETSAKGLELDAARVEAKVQVAPSSAQAKVDPLATYLARHERGDGEFRVRLAMASAIAALLGVVAALV